MYQIPTGLASLILTTIIQSPTRIQAHLDTALLHMMSSKQQGTEQTHEKGPNLNNSWKEVMKKVDQIDDGLGQGWKEDIDTLLVFAGLFSAVVAAFTIESYKWLSEDPANATVTILNQIARQLDGQNFTTVDENPPFSPSSSVVRINTFWFLSLILALVDALLGLMFKQWLREHRRPTNTQTPEQWLALRCFRSESLHRWHVPSFLATLPIILELALFLFFAGLLELLWTRHHIPFACAMSVIGSAVGFYITTTLLPGIDLIRLAFRIHPEIQKSPSKYYWGNGRWKRTFLNLPQIHYLCPYKSPQAWAMFRVLVWLVSSPLPICRKAISYRLRKRFYKRDSDVDIYGDPLSTESWTPSVINRISNLASWSSTDLDIVQCFSKIENCPDMYALKAYRWLVQEFRDSPAMMPHLRMLLKEVPPLLIMPMALYSEIVRVDRDWHEEDIDEALRRGPQPRDRELEYSDMNIRFLFFHNMWIQQRDLWVLHLAFIPESELASHLPWNGHRAPLTRILQLMTGIAAEQRLAFEGYLENIITNDKLGSDRTVDWADIIRCLPNPVKALTRIHLENLSHREQLYGFLFEIRRGVINNFDYLLTSFAEAYAFLDAFNAFRIAHNLSIDYFEPIPGFFPISMDSLSMLLRDPSPSTVIMGREILEEYKRVWDNHKTSDDFWGARFVLDYLTKYILARIPRDRWEGHVQGVMISRSMEEFSENSTDDIPHILTCDDGLSLLKYLELPAEWAGYRVDTLGAWRSALKCVAHINGLPLDYFTNTENR